MRFDEVLTESRTGITHIEDLVFIDGYFGVTHAIETLADIAEELSTGAESTNKITTKWDGSPAIFAGTDPEDGKFFVGTKSAFAKKVPRRIKKLSDVNKFYPDQEEEGDRGELRHKLTVAFKNLKGLSRSERVFQGDMMFTQEDLHTETIDGEQMLIVHPNTVVYAIPVGSTLANEMQAAQMGIVWHTVWDGGPTVNDMTPSPLGDTKLPPAKGVWQDNATYKNYTGIATLTKSEQEKIKQRMLTAVGLRKDVGASGFAKVFANKDFEKHLLPFVNNRVRAGKHAEKPAAFLKAFLEFYKEKLLAGADNLTQSAQEKRQQKVQDMIAFIKDNKETLFGIINLYNAIVEMKMMLFKKLNRIDSMKTFKKTENGFEVTSHEGFVAINKKGGVVKLIDRLEFSRLNFMK